jgi:hypothetical protein
MQIRFSPLTGARRLWPAPAVPSAAAVALAGAAAIVLALPAAPAHAQGHAHAQAASTGAAPRTPAPDGARVYFIEPRDGATVRGPVKVVMGLAGMGVAPAGISIPNTGHHHILVNHPGNLDLNAALQTDDTHRHFGLGQTEATLNLPPGRHTLRLVLGDANHVPHQPPVMSETITITVQP